MMQLAWFIHQDIAAMGTHIGETVQFVLLVTGDDQRLLKVIFNKSEWICCTCI